MSVHCPTFRTDGSWHSADVFWEVSCGLGKATAVVSAVLTTLPYKCMRCSSVNLPLLEWGIFISQSSFGNSWTFPRVPAAQGSYSCSTSSTQVWQVYSLLPKDQMFTPVSPPDWIKKKKKEKKNTVRGQNQAWEPPLWCESSWHTWDLEPLGHCAFSGLQNALVTSRECATSSTSESSCLSPWTTSEISVMISIFFSAAAHSFYTL